MATVGNAGNRQFKSPKEAAQPVVIIIAMIILFGGAAYFTGRLYGKVGMYAASSLGSFSSPAHFHYRRR